MRSWKAWLTALSAPLVAVAIPSCGSSSQLASTAVPSGLAADIVIPARAQAAPDFTLLDQDGQPVSISGMRGKVVVISFLDSHCKQLCPIQADQLRQAQQALGAKSPMTLLVVSVAPETDTPASERAFADAHKWSGDWHWLNGGADQLATVWKNYSIAVQSSSTDIVHSTVVYLIDRSGYERAGWAAGLQPALLAHDVRLLNAAG
jgi:protein SCO1/2